MPSTAAERSGSLPEEEAELFSANPASASRHTYGQILKSSFLIASSTAFNVLTGMVRSKVMALLLGPAGFGLMGLYSSIVQVVQSIAGLGVNSSGVREIAAAVGTGDTGRIARTAAVLRRTSLALGLLGGGVLFLLSGPVAKLTFGNHERTIPVALLALAVFFGIVSSGQGALIQGMRRIGDLARKEVLGGLCGTILTVALVYALRERGLVPALVGTAGITLLFSWWYSRKTGIRTPPLSMLDAGREAGGLLKLGFAFMASGMLMTGAAYLVRIIIVRHISLHAAGLYSSAWTIGGLYVGFVLDAMGADFYPRLTASIHDYEECNRVVNEQTHVSLLLAGPGVIATLTFTPLVIPLLYSSKFMEAVSLLRWLCLGISLRVITWPLGFIIVAGARRLTFMLVELAYVVVYIAAAWACLGPLALGVDGAGVAFLLSYVFHGFMLYPVVRRQTGFRWSPANRRLLGGFLVVIGAVFAGFHFLPSGLSLAIGSVAFLANTLYSARALASLVSKDQIPLPFRRVLAWIQPTRMRTGDPR
jgi:antigen flippase